MPQLFIGATLIDGTGAPAQRDTAVLVNDGRIAGWARVKRSLSPPDAEVIDCSGLSLLPGLIDCHDHLASHTYSLAHRWGLDQPQSTRHVRTAAVLQQTLATGYTTVRDAAGLDAGFKQAMEEALLQGPRLLLAVNIISPTVALATASAPPDIPAASPPIPPCRRASPMASRAYGRSSARWCALAPM